MWFRLADRLGLPLQVVQKKTTSTEFREWVAYMEMDVNEGFHRYDHYFAKLIATLKQCFSKDPRTIKQADQLIEFASEKPTEKDPEQLRDRAQQSKRHWLGVFKIKGEL